MSTMFRAILFASLVVATGCSSQTPPPATPIDVRPPVSPAPVATQAPAPAVRAIPYDLPRVGDTPWLPPAATGERVVPVFVVAIDAKGGWYANGVPVTPHEKLVQLAREAYAKDSATRAVLQADRSTSWNDVVHAIDLLKQGGLGKLAFAVAPASAP